MMMNRLATLLAVVSLAGIGSQTSAAPIAYSATPNSATKTIDMSIVVPVRRNQPLSVQIPHWAPGAYIIQDFASNIENVEAHDAKGATLAVTHPDALTWSVAPTASSPVTITYAVANSDVEEMRAHISGPRTYMYVVGRKTEPVTLTLHTPTAWKIATFLDPSRMPGTWIAPGYDVMADAPIEMGNYGEEDFKIGKTPVTLVLYGDYAAIDRAKLKQYCEAIVKEETTFMGDVPFHRYFFEFHWTAGQGGGAGGLEHLGATEIGCVGNVTDVTRSVTAHEFFHLWNVKRARPFVLGPFDYTGPCKTRNLWWSEGVTSYYGDLLSRRANINTPEEYIAHLGNVVTQLQNTPARLTVSADDSSYYVWTGGGSQGYKGLSYYVKGELIGLCMDLRIRHDTHGAHSLDDVMRSLYQQCGRGFGPGFGEDAIKTTINAVSGEDLSDLYDTMARKPGEMPMNECLVYAGLRAVQSDEVLTIPVVGMFARPDRTDGTLRAMFVQDGTPAANAGVQRGDTIVTINGEPASSPTARALIAPQSAKPGQEVHLGLQRDGKNLDVILTVGSQERRTWKVQSMESPTKDQLALRRAWLAQR